MRPTTTALIRTIIPTRMTPTGGTRTASGTTITASLKGRSPRVRYSPWAFRGASFLARPPLVVLLSAVALHRIAYGMALITAFSVGLASVLIIIGLMVVSTRHWFERFPAGEGLLRRLPVASAAAITLIGIMLVVRAITQGV